MTYIIKTKQGLVKEINQLTQQEIEETIHFNEIKTRQKIEQIERAERRLELLLEEEQNINMQILELADRKDDIQRQIDYNNKLIDNETHKKTTINNISSVLMKIYNPNIHLLEYVTETLEPLQIVE